MLRQKAGQNQMDMQVKASGNQARWVCEARHYRPACNTPSTALPQRRIQARDFSGNTSSLQKNRDMERSGARQARIFHRSANIAHSAKKGRQKNQKLWLT